MAGEMITSLKALLSPQMAKYVGSSCSQQLRGAGQVRAGMEAWALAPGSAPPPCLQGPQPDPASKAVSLGPGSLLLPGPRPGTGKLEPQPRFLPSLLAAFYSILGRAPVVSGGSPCREGGPNPLTVQEVGGAHQMAHSPPLLPRRHPHSDLPTDPQAVGDPLLWFE